MESMSRDFERDRAEKGRELNRRENSPSGAVEHIKEEGEGVAGDRE
jgi:hypothetical protein